MGFAAAAAIVTILSAAVSAYSQYQQGQTAAKVGRAQSRQAEQQALAARQAAEVREQQERRRLDRVRATTRTRAAASGVLATEGSPLLVVLENARQAELEAQLIRYSGEIQGQELEFESRLQLFKGRQARRAANIGAGATLLSGLSSAAGIYGKRPRSTTPAVTPVTE